MMKKTTVLALSLLALSTSARSESRFDQLPRSAAYEGTVSEVGVMRDGLGHALPKTAWRSCRVEITAKGVAYEFASDRGVFPQSNGESDPEGVKNLADALENSSKSADPITTGLRDPDALENLNGDHPNNIVVEVGGGKVNQVTVYPFHLGAGYFQRLDQSYGLVCGDLKLVQQFE
jgi:hypothetical protein